MKAAIWLLIWMATSLAIGVGWMLLQPPPEPVDLIQPDPLQVRFMCTLYFDGGVTSCRELR